MLQARLASTTIIQKSSLYGDQSARFVAFLIDSTLLVFFYSLIYYSAAKAPELMLSWNKSVFQSGFSLETMLVELKILFFNPYFLVAHWLYYTLLEASPRQASIGKFVLGLQVTDLRGKRINLLKSNYRYIAKILSSIPLLAGFFYIINDRRKQTFYDYITRTVVVSDPKNRKNTNALSNRLNIFAYNEA
ncbi:RDD family protein [Pontibacter sp. 13R65]|uniref:RDD family protein n=1 Tax=Pontibacter sp. 13R65 TaxID=3127458 RepID=UPI00301E0A4D